MRMNEQYRLYFLNLQVEVMTDEINELMQYGISPLGVGKARPLDKERQKAIRSLLDKVSDTVREAAVNMIEKTVMPVDEAKAEDWINVMLEELRTRTSEIGGEYSEALKEIAGLIDQMGNILNRR